LLVSRDYLRGGGEVQLRTVLLGDLGADLGGLFTDGVPDVGGVERHDHLVPEIFHGAPPRPSSPAGLHQRCYAPPPARPSGPSPPPVPALTTAGPAVPARRRRSRGHGRAGRWRP